MKKEKKDILSLDLNEVDDTGIENLAMGIVQQAAEDYKDAFLGKYVDGKPPQMVLDELDRWFQSEYYMMLTKIDGKKLMQKIRIHALEEIVRIYETYLSRGSGGQFKVYIQNPGKIENVTLIIPPKFVEPYRQTMIKQIRELKAQIKKEELCDTKAG